MKLIEKLQASLNAAVDKLPAEAREAWTPIKTALTALLEKLTPGQEDTIGLNTLGEALVQMQAIWSDVTARLNRMAEEAQTRVASLNRLGDLEGQAGQEVPGRRSE